MEWNSPNRTIFESNNVSIKFGKGALAEVGYEAKELDMSNILLVTDENLNENTDHPSYVMGILEDEGLDVEIYDQAPVEPNDKDVEKAIEFAEGKDYDGFIGFGGGSSMDTAKMANLYTTYPTDDFLDYVAPPTGGGKKVPGPIKPLLAIPTTSGTGSENTPVAIVDLLDENLKVGISSKYLRPDRGLLDPLVTMTLDPYYTMSTGMDAFFHSFECYTCKPYNWRKRVPAEERPDYVGANPPSDMFAERSMELVSEYLRRAYHNPDDIEARENMMLAAHLGGSFGNAGVHMPHTLAYPIAARRHELPHGVTVSVFGPPTMDFIAPVMEKRMAKVAKLVGIDTKRMSTTEAAKAASDEIIRLMKDIDFPSGIAEFDFGEEDIDELAEDGYKIQRLLKGVPRQVEVDDLKKILRESLNIY